MSATHFEITSCTFLLAYIIQRGFIVIFAYMHTLYHNQIHPLYPSLSPSSFLKIISTGFIVLFLYMCVEYF
jgi:hypothetical protein